MSSPSSNAVETASVTISAAVAASPPTTPHRSSVGAGEPAASRIPKPSPLPVRRALSQRLRSGSVGALTQLDYSKPYNCSFSVAEESTDYDCGPTSLTSPSSQPPPCPDCRTHYIDCEPDAFGVITAPSSLHTIGASDASPPSIASAALLHRRQHQLPARSGKPQQRRVSCVASIALPNSKSLSSIGGSGSRTMAHTTGGKKESPAAHANGKIGRAHSLHHGMVSAVVRGGCSASLAAVRHGRV